MFYTYIYVHITCIYRYIRLLVNLPSLLPDPNVKLNQLTGFFFQRKRRSWERRCYRSSLCVGSSSSSSSCSSTCVVCSTSARYPGEPLSPPSPQVGQESPGEHGVSTTHPFIGSHLFSCMYTHEMVYLRLSF